MRLSEIDNILNSEIRGHWLDFLAYHGINVNPLKNTPCPICGGRDRFVFGDRNGDGTFFCRGGDSGREHKGNGWTLLRECLYWDRRTANQRVMEYLGGRVVLPPLIAQKGLVVKPDSASKSSTGDYALKCWAKASPDLQRVASHPYAIKKEILCQTGARRGTVSGKIIGSCADCIVVPAYHFPTMEVKAIQCINKIGDKQTFGPLKNHGYFLGDIVNSNRLFVVEGWADCASMVLHHGYPAAVAALGKSNFKNLLDKLLCAYPEKEFVVLEDSE